MEKIRKLDSPTNLLPQEGEVFYYGSVFESTEADRICHQLLKQIAWQQDEAIMFGRKIITKRKVAWYGDRPFEYTYSRTTKQAIPWIPILLELKDVAQQHTGSTYNSCLLNLYHNGGEGMAWHSDDEKDLKKNGAIASLSFGAKRKFALRHKQTKEKVECFLEHGSLVVMQGATQTHWHHALPTTKKIHEPRVNLTFRTIL